MNTNITMNNDTGNIKNCIFYGVLSQARNSYESHKHSLIYFIQIYT